MAVGPSDSASRARSGREMLRAEPTRLAAMVAVVVVIQMCKEIGEKRFDVAMS